jgi:Family of unknown function (DUF5522)
VKYGAKLAFSGQHVSDINGYKKIKKNKKKFAEGDMKKKPIPKPTPVTEGDYYIENGHWVFTEQYHLKRGYCCESGCRHCPYGFTKKADQQPKADRK